MNRSRRASSPPVRGRTGSGGHAPIGHVPIAAIVALVIVAMVALVACGDAPSSSPRPAATPGASVVAGASGSVVTPGASVPAGETATPDETATPETTEPPAPSETPAAPTTGGADGCSGSAENRDFFAAAAEAFTWDVYCAVLPDGWFLETGTFRQADGGRLEVSYKGPGGARIEIAEGAWCTAGASACSPRDHEIGPGRFGDREGTLVTLGPDVADGFAVYVDPGAAPSWAISGTGMDQSSFEAIAAALHRVDG